MKLQPMAIANIERVDIITEEATPMVYTFDTASDASAEAQISAGTENELRVGNRILAQNITEDIVKGYNISLTDSVFAPEVFTLLDGGAIEIAEDSSTGTYSFRKYTALSAGKVPERTKFQIAVYAAEKDYDGGTLSYTAFVFPNAKGSPASVSFKDGEFFAPSYTIKSRPSKGSKPMTVVALPDLPVIVKRADDLPANPVALKTTILIAGTDLGSDVFTETSVPTIGSYARYNGTAYKVL